MNGLILSLDSGIEDENFDLLINCFPLITYVLINLRYKEHKSKFMLSMINNLLYSVELDEHNNFIDVRQSYDHWNDFVSFSESDDNSIDAVIDMIDQDGYAIVQTIVPLLPFIREYDPEYNISEFKRGHAFLILGYDSEHYYYFEHKASLHRDNFVPYQENKEVGMVKRSILDEVFKKMLVISKIEFKNGDMLDENCVKSYIKEMLRNYHLKYFQNSNTENVFSGNEGITQLINCFREPIDVTERSKAFPHTYVGGILAWRLCSIRNAWKLIHKWFEENPNVFDNQVKLEETSLLLYKMWSIAASKSLKYYNVKKSLSIYEQLLEILKHEHQFVLFLKQSNHLLE